MEAYLDYAATTPVSEAVKERMLCAYSADFGNPSSRHKKGFEAEKMVLQARKKLAETLKCLEKEIVFTSGGTESNNHALIGCATANSRRGKHIITSSIEHASVLEPLFYLEGQGYEVTYLPVDADGRVRAEDVEAAVRDDTIMLSLMHVNNEIGSIQPLEALIQAARGKNPNLLVHVDAIQSYGKLPIIPKRMGIDLLSVSAHKIHGPKGVGMLYVKDKTKIRPIIFGGGQQDGMRSGTENVAGIVGLAEAAAKMYEQMDAYREQLYAKKEYFVDLLQKEIEGVTINGIKNVPLRETAPHIVSVSFRGIKSQVLLNALEEDGIYVSSGSACSSNHPQLSGTLKAIHVADDLLDSTLRFSFSQLTTKEELSYAVDRLKVHLPVLRKYYRH